MKNKLNNNSILKALFIGLLVIFVVTAFAKAETGDDNETQVAKQALNVRYDHLLCKVTFTNTQIDSINQYLGVDLTSYKDVLNNDMNQLQTLQNSDNKTLFDQYITDVISKDMQNITLKLNDAKKNLGSYNLTNDTRTAFKNDIKTAKQVYDACVSDKEIKMSEVLKKHYQNSENQWDKQIQSFEKRNITTDELNQIKQELNDSLQKLQDAINSGNATLIRQVMEDIRQSNLHLWARFETAKLKGYMEKIGPMAEKYGKSGEIDKLKKHLDNITNETMPGRRFNEGDQQQVWSQIRDAYKNMSDTSKDILKQEREDMKNLRNISRGRPPNNSGRGVKNGQ